ncbi:SMI1/KNR4 family protein [Flavobacterium sp. HSC-61S13]|uniref:SMI1/KNR4 family protein n=1 Tax=Flavobacterium sp. HSC-61S13 TaxID=2910963 RepID=UPI00209E501D|nr:SMI1/KNR4 family protein [Flavobacterium sp. HSC-61S13]MCP1995288.1 hypothetical protein [Flavobacterium sp. HSC-61S13]
MINIEDSERRLPDNSIVQFEKKWNILLPNNYKVFLNKFNGGIIYDYHPFLNSFNSLVYNENNSLLDDTYEIYCFINKDIEKEFLPIGATHNNNPITLCLKAGKNYGKVIVFYFDRDQEPEIIADSLEALLGVKSMDEI